MILSNDLTPILKRNNQIFHPVVPFNPSADRLISLDLTAGNKDLSENIFLDTEKFTAFIHDHIVSKGAKYAIGGYNELRTMYSRSEVFNAGHPYEEPRRLHLGIDIWGEAGTIVFCPLGGMVHSCAMNNANGDYGATIILLHQLEGISFYTLYGHLCERDLVISPGMYINHGQEMAHFGEAWENGNWPSHLHFQIILDMELKEGDYPGVCRFSEREKYLNNCPDPDFILQLNQFVHHTDFAR